LTGRQEGGAPEHKCLDIIEYQKSEARSWGNSFPDQVPFLCGWVLLGNQGKKGIMDIL
jgi:hypothetical protein